MGKDTYKSYRQKFIKIISKIYTPILKQQKANWKQVEVPNKQFFEEDINMAHR